MLTDQEADEIARRIATFAMQRGPDDYARKAPAVALVATGWAVRVAIVVLGLVLWTVAEALPVTVRIALVAVVVMVADL
ncbi:hypothetical protein [Conexibacter arvalis]|uniref:Uncharacterized protein n=1 Tax=Conexibacter arvalis TaxID=912552 RepID=A0A840ICX6_9ACTN|nr:hypothetical protein [Conexibacter arvalis]MBB4662195.1 hypothetical protein [Conexibacter arvalis]